MINGQNGHGDVLTEADVINQLRQGGVVDEVMRHIQVDGAQSSKPAAHFVEMAKGASQELSKKGRLQFNRNSPFIFKSVHSGKIYIRTLVSPYSKTLNCRLSA